MFRPFDDQGPRQGGVGPISMRLFATSVDHSDSGPPGLAEPVPAARAMPRCGAAAWPVTFSGCLSEPCGTGPHDAYPEGTCHPPSLARSSGAATMA